ncbi:Metallo-beta-lactamase protein [Pleurostoma richardsiae]|uniref:Metallo-beta-lactamase protein n=1 Tax=Pleurostoma richardsiae TaxID=41990 RepID=A0AA38VPM7_9PEZI|nr:Metallo-beta-lactamase protein [Pleurostoma richardsiae]
MPNQLQVDVYVAPSIPVVSSFKDPLKQWFSPICCTLIHGPISAVLVDTPTTIELTGGLLEWIKKTAPGKTVRYIYTTHAHGDHFFGNPLIVEQFPGAKCVATSSVVDAVKTFLSEQLARWHGMYPNGQIPDGQIIPEPLPENGEFSIDGESVFGIDVPYSDTQASSFLYAPSLKLVVAGDIVYGDYHQFLGEANTVEKRKLWLAALDQISALEPDIVVPGHKRSSQVDGAYLIDFTRAYILTFEHELEKLKDSDKLEEAMKRRYPNRRGEFILGLSCKPSVENHLVVTTKE